MGMNILVYKFLGKRDNGSLILKNVSSDIGFDEGKYSFDREFVLAFNPNNGFDYDKQSDEDDVICRPKDVNSAKKWVEENVTVEGNRDRLNILLDAMEEDKDIYIYLSY